MAVVTGVLFGDLSEGWAVSKLKAMTEQLDTTTLDCALFDVSTGLAIAVHEHPRFLSSVESAFIQRESETIWYGDLSLFDHGSILERKNGNELALVSRFVQKSGDSAIEAVNGDYCLVRYAPDTGELTFFRDHIGHKSWFYTFANGALHFSSIPQPLFALGGGTPPLVPERLAAFRCLGHPGLGHTLHKGICEVPAASIAKCTTSTVLSVKRFWHPQVHKAGGQDDVQSLRKKLENATRSRMAGVPYETGISLSGGLDSGAICGLACSAEPGANLPMFSYVPDENKSPEGTTETAFIRETLQLWNQMNWHKVTADDLDLSGAGDDWARWFIRPCHDPTYAVDKAINRLAGKSGVRALLSGFGGDQFVSMPGGMAISDMLTNLRFSNAVSQFKRLRRRHRKSGLLRFLNARALSPLLPVRMRIAMQSLKGRNWASELGLLPTWQGDQKLRDILCENAFMPFSLTPATIRRAELASLQSLDHYNLPAFDFFANLEGVKLRYPLLDKEVIELTLALPSTSKFSNFSDRTLLRRACKDILAEPVAQRNDKSPFFPDMPAEVARLVETGELGLRRNHNSKLWNATMNTKPAAIMNGAVTSYEQAIEIILCAYIDAFITTSQATASQ